ncbi:ATP-binding cassette sub-family C member 4-like isoform X2 [Onthophagus taurus]|nr:multidrug resistance-associated protein 4-like isoform X2 [Onthophagus taurus]
MRRLRSAIQTDKRLKIVEEVLSSIRMIKMYTWESYFIKKMNEFRRNEIFNLRIIFYLRNLIMHISLVAVRIGVFTSILYYTRKSALVIPANIYLILSCMHTIRMVTAVDFPKLLYSWAEIAASMKRIQNLLISDDASLYLTNEDVPQMNANDPSIEINATISVKDNTSFLKADLKLEKKLIALTGPLGSGTTLFMKTLQGDLPYKGDIKINGTLSYAAQEPWLYPGTIKDNILFGKTFSKERYHKILKICALEKDIHNFPNGDETFVNDDGICLSRGQQGRINLARALYKEADIYLLDNCLSSLDTNIKNHIFENCMKSFLKDKLCIYSTNRDTYFKQADVILTIRDGQVEIVDNHEKIKTILLDKHDDIDEDYSGIIYKSGLVEADEKTKLIDQTQNNMYHEENKLGKVPFKVYGEYFKRCGYFHIVLLLLIYIIYQGGSSFFEKFIQQWADLQGMSNQITNATNATIVRRIQIEQAKMPRIFGVTMAAITIAYLLKTYLFFYMTAKTSKKLHKMTFTNVIHAPIAFFDEHLVGNIMNRFSKDVGTIDEYIPFITDSLLQYIFLCLGALVLIGFHSLLILILSVVMICIIWIIRFIYMPICRSLKRLEAATRSPVIGLLRTSLEGVNTIRSSGMTRKLREEFDKHQNLHTSADYTYLTVNRALCFCVEFILSLYLAGVVFICIFYLNGSTAGKVGLILTQAYSISKFLQSVIRSFTDLETQMTSVERVLEYRDIKTESTSGKSYDNWPSTGKIEYKKVNLRYPKTNQLVLKNLTFSIAPKERVCLIGRTGSGKTSMMSTLFRLYETETGKIYLDDTDTTEMNLKTLRSGISIIPQNPILFTGDLRSNLDPNNKYPDNVLWQALNEVNLKTMCSETITLDTKINENGKTFSAGQKQLICLARALIKRNKILILDEATSYLDNDTTDVIDKLINTKFSDCTIITILHRLKTVLNYDKVMILKDGDVIEFDSPNVLLKDKGSVFYNIMANED